MSAMPNFLATADTRNEARSLKDEVGLAPSSLMNRRLNPSLLLRLAGSHSGVLPTGMAGK